VIREIHGEIKKWVEIPREQISYWGAIPYVAENGKLVIYYPHTRLWPALQPVLRLCAAGYLSKGYAQFSASPLADPAQADVKRKLRQLHPQPGDESGGGRVVTPPVPVPGDFPDSPGVRAARTSWEAFCEVFARPPQERGLSLDGLSYEELQMLFHATERYKSTLYALVCDINAGRCHPDEVAILGESLLVGLKKPDGGTRPIGIGAALRRLAGRCAMVDHREQMETMFTTSKPDANMLAVEAPDGPAERLGARGGALHRGLAAARRHLPQRRAQAQALPPAHLGAPPLRAAPSGPASPRRGGRRRWGAPEPQRQAV